MIGAEGSLLDAERSSIHWLGFAIAVGVRKQPSKVVQASCHVGVIGAEGSHSDAKRSLTQRLGLAFAVGVGK